MATKKVLLDWSETGSTVYTIVERDADGALLNDADGSFTTVSTVADPYWSLIEHSIIKGRYSATRSDATWSTGLHTYAVYSQAGTAAVPASDTIIGTGLIFIVGDAEVVLDKSVASLNDLSTADVAAIPMTVSTAQLPPQIKKNTALAGFTFYMVSTVDNISGATGLTVTEEVSIDGGAFGALTNAFNEIGSGVYKIDLSAADLNGDTITLKFTATGANAEVITIITQP